jgi:hypothetical protein
MARTNVVRFDETVQYIRTYIDAGLAQNIENIILQNRSKDSVGADLSLSGHKYWKNGTDGQHKAVRALILCQKTYLTENYAVGANGGGFNYEHDADRTYLPKDYYLKKTEEEVKRAVKCYWPILTASRDDLVTAATGISNPQGITHWLTLTRDTDPFPNMPVCFDALKMWLFKAGFVSLRWLAKTGPLMTAQTVNAMLGDGVIIEERDLNSIPAGYLFNFHRKGDKAVCHWGVSLGSGWAAGSNTSANWLGSPAPVRFRSGDSKYGEFTLQSSLDVCKNKYARKESGEKTVEVTIRKIDPTVVTTYF